MNILDAQDKRQTALLSTGDRRPGYFRIGFIVLDIPPEDVVTTRVTNADEATPLRAKFPMFVKTGQSRWDVTISWTAVANPTPDDTTDYSQWNDLQYIVAMFKASPFIEVENSHLRQVFFAIDPTMEHQRMAFGMRQLKVETSPDMVNALSCTLTMTYFNYYPYTLDFGYIGLNNDPVSAYQSQAFKDYLDNWIGTNLTEPVPADADDFPTGMGWLDQIQGTLRLKWRVYMPVPIDQTDPSKIPSPPTAPAPPAPSLKRPPRIPTPPVTTDSGRSLALSSKVTPAFADKVASISVSLGIDPNWLMTVMSFETGGTFSPSVQNRAGSGAVGLIQFTRQTAIGLGTSTTELAAMSAEDQLDYVYAYLQRYSGSMHNTGDVAMAVFAPVSVGKEDSFILYRSPTRAYSLNQGLDRAGKGYITRGDYVSSLGPVASNTTTQARVVPASVITPAPPAISDPSPANKNMSQQGLDKSNADMAAQVSQLNTELGNRGWKLDYSTEKDAFFYQENDILLTDESHGDNENQFSLYPEGMTVLFVNNLAQIPLSSYQYPTYQHVGPATTLVSIAMKSNGLYREDADAGDQEPMHPGIQSLSVMSHTLEDQFHRMKARWRSVVSIHRMQAVRVYNQFLNLLGVHSILLKDVNTATISESPNAVMVQLTGAHYENFFEEVGEYLVKGLKNAYTKPFLDYLQNDIDKGLSADEKKSIFQLLKYRDAMKSHDVDVIGQILVDKKLGTFAPVPLPITLSAAEQAQFKDLLQKGVGVELDTGPTGNVTEQSIQLDYADYAARVSGNISLTDFLLVNSLDKNFAQFKVGDTSVTEDVHSSVTSVLERLKTSPEFNASMDQIYTDLLSQAAQRDPIFNQQMQLVVNDPKFRKAMSSVGHPTGSPGEDNPGHGAYRDLGIRGLSSGGEDLNPGSYFFDYSKETFKSIKDGITQVAADAATANAQLNKPSSDAANPTISDGIDNDQFMKAINAPETRMSAAFPTYKLFLLEEDNSGTFYAFDDFYSYSSVIDVEIIKYRDRPHLAKIIMTNLANLLSHKLFDDTVMGKHEADLAKFNVKMPVTDSKGRVIASPTGSIIENAGEDLLGRNYIKLPGKTLSEGYGSGFNEIPLAYFPLQPGTKIEVRMGFSNNPDLLTRVFSGTVAEIEGDEILTITAQGFQAELMELASDKVGTDQFWSLSTLLHAGFKKGPRFGGVKIWGDAGDTGTIMKKVLEVSNAKHFGHWQLLKPDSPLMRGWPWQRSLGLALENLGSTTIGPLLQTGSDRTGQNILINHVINGVGKNTTNVRGKRTFFSQTPWWKFASWYSLDEDEDKERTIWDIIQDVSRRYPEYILSVKDYGFPYGCDATMVFGHPRDSYYARPFNYDEGRNEKQLNDNAAAEFKSWWTTQGRTLTLASLRTAHEVSPYFIRAVFATGIPNIQGDSDFSFEASKSGLSSNEPNVINDIDSRGVTAFNDLFDHVAHSTGRQIGDFITTILPNIFVDQGKFDQSLRELLAIQRQWQSYRNSVKPTANALLQPIRKYHYIDHQTIIHNGLVVNDHIFNAVRICNKVVPANQNIPPNHIRVLDCDSAIIRPSDNVDDQHLTNAYAESFLREEVGKMYRGEIILRGLPKIDPWDVLFITDPSTGITGPVVVDKVIHSFNQEQGYITIVTPMVYISVNEASGQEFIKRLAIGLANAHKLAWAGFNEFVQSDVIGQRAALLLPAAGALTAAGTVSAASGLASGIAAPVVSLIPAASATPPGWLAWAVLGALAVGGVSYVIARNTELNPILVSPLMRFGKPWIGGLEGYEISDFARLVHNEWRNFWIDEIEPTLLSFKVAKGYVDNTIL